MIGELFTTYGWFTGTLAVLLALVIVVLAIQGMRAKKLLHSALAMLFVMIGLAVEYAVLGAPFVFVVQMIVYAGAIMVMIMFIVMMVGDHAQRSARDPIPGQRLAACLSAGVMFLALATAVLSTDFGAPAGVAEATGPMGNVAALGTLIFGRYVVVFEILSAALIVAAVGAMVLLFRTRPEARPSQREFSEARLRAYAEHGVDPGAAAAPGVYAASNAIDLPALLPDGTEYTNSVSPTSRFHNAEAGVDTDPQGYRSRTQQLYRQLAAQQERDE